MSYFLTKKLSNTNIKDAIAKVTETLKEEGFGIISEINVSETLKKKIDVDYKDYIILGACNPHFAYKALQSEDLIGLFLPCNFVVIDQGEGTIEIASIDPLASMAAVENKEMGEFAQKVKESLTSVINNL